MNPTTIPKPHKQVKTNSLALTSMIIGIVCIVFPFLPIIPPLLAIIFGFSTLSQIKQRKEEGRGMAIAGVIMGFASILVTIIFGLIIFLIASAANDTISYSMNNVNNMIEESNVNCHTNDDLECVDAKLNGQFMTLTFKNSKTVPLEDLTVKIQGTYCDGEQPLGTLDPNEERTIIYPCNRNTLLSNFIIMSGSNVQTTGQINIR